MPQRTPYPSTPPVECVVEAIQIARSGDLRLRLQEFAADVYTVAGYVLAVSVGAPPVVIAGDERPETLAAEGVAAVESPSPEFRAQLQELAALSASVESQLAAARGAVGASGEPATAVPSWVIEWIEQAFAAILAWLRA